MTSSNESNNNVSSQQSIADEPGLELSAWQRVVFSILLFAIHQIFNLVTSLVLHLKYFWTIFLESCPVIRSRPLTFEKISEDCKSGLTKWPSHVAFAFLEPTKSICIKKVSHSVVWALASGANCVSLYDISGHLKQRQFELLTQIRKTISEYCGSDDDSFSKKFRLEWHPHNESETEIENRSVVFQRSGRNGKKNGERTEMSSNEMSSNEMSSYTTIHLSLLSARDGRQDLVSATRHLAQQASIGQLDIESIDENLISETLQTNRGLPDPTILIRIGLCSSNLGFLPWQTRLTEIYDWPSLMTFTFQNFFKLLQKFSKCEQRFGR